MSLIRRVAPIPGLDAFPLVTSDVLLDVALERERQNARWGRVAGEWFVPNSDKLVVLVEEVGEVARAICDGDADDHLLEELVQVAAVATAWAETLRRKR